MKISTVLPLSIIASATLVGAAGTAWQHYGYGSPTWPMHAPDGHYECMPMDAGKRVCFWQGDPLPDGRYVVIQSAYR